MAGTMGFIESPEYYSNSERYYQQLKAHQIYFLQLWRQGKDLWNRWHRENPDTVVDFSGVVFPDDCANFAKYEFGSDAIFTKAKFRGDVDFEGVRVSCYLDFSHAEILGNADFSNAEVGFEAFFNDMKIHGNIDISGLSFYDSKMEKISIPVQRQLN